MEAHKEINLLMALTAMENSITNSKVCCHEIYIQAAILGNSTLPMQGSEFHTFLPYFSVPDPLPNDHMDQKSEL